MLNYVRKIGLDYLSEMFKKLEAKRTQLPQDLYKCLKTEIRIVSQRIHSVRAYAIHKISKMKAQQCMVEHRLEEWMIYSIKHRNRQIYQKCSYLKDCIEKVLLAEPRKTTTSPPRSRRGTPSRRSRSSTSTSAPKTWPCPNPCSTQTGV